MPYALALATCLAAAPAGFEWRRQPIHPNCVRALTAPGRDADRVSLERCSRTSGAVAIANGRREWTSGEEQASYAVVGRLGEAWVVDWAWSGGGSGSFTGVILLRLEQGQLREDRALTAGDRCHGGLTKAELVGDKVRVWVRATAGAVLTAAAPSSSAALPEALPASALSCVGELAHGFGATAAGDEGVVGARLEPDLEEEPRATASARCYVAAQRRFTTAHPGVIDWPLLQAFAREVEASCRSTDGGPSTPR